MNSEQETSGSVEKVQNVQGEQDIQMEDIASPDVSTSTDSKTSTDGVDKDGSDTISISSTTSTITSRSGKAKKLSSSETLRRQLREEELVFTTDYLLDISRNFDPDRSPKDMFILASLYAKSTNETLLRQAEEWLKQLLSESHSGLLGPNYKSDCCYLLSWANFRLREFKESRRYAEKLVHLNPLNNQAVELITLIDEEISKEARKGVIYGSIAAGAATAAFGVVGLATAGLVMLAMNKKS